MDAISKVNQWLHAPRNESVQTNMKVAIPNKKQGILWALAASAAILAAVIFALISAGAAVVAVSSMIAHLVTVPAGLVQFAAAIMSVVLSLVFGYVAYNAIKNAQFHLRGKKVDHDKSKSREIAKDAAAGIEEGVSKFKSEATHAGDTFKRMGKTFGDTAHRDVRKMAHEFKGEVKKGVKEFEQVVHA